MTSSSSHEPPSLPTVATSAGGPPPLPPEPVIEARGLARWYGPVIGLTDLSVRIPIGLTGLLGPNGAGKSTLFKLVTGQIRPSQGEVRLLGEDPVTTPEVFRRVGFCSEHDALFETMTPREMVGMLARANGYSSAQARERAERALERVGLQDARDRKVRGFSKGMRQRTRLAASIVHEPELLLLDEPMTGLDPVGRRMIIDFVRAFAKDGGSVVFSSHILHEVESVADYIIVILKGVLRAEGTQREIRAAMQEREYELRVACAEPRRLARALVGERRVHKLRLAEDAVWVGGFDPSELSLALTRIIAEEGHLVSEITSPKESLESLFESLA